jgi:hypothetical protein
LRLIKYDGKYSILFSCTVLCCPTSRITGRAKPAPAHHLVGHAKSGFSIYLDDLACFRLAQSEHLYTVSSIIFDCPIHIPEDIRPSISCENHANTNANANFNVNFIDHRDRGEAVIG